MKLEGFENIKALHFDIPQRKLEVINRDNAEPISAAIDSLQFNSKLISTGEVDDEELILEDHRKEKYIFLTVFIINFSFSSK